MIDQRSKIGKMIDRNKCVWACIVCGYSYIGDSKLDKCPSCNRKDCIVIQGNFIVTK